MDLLSLDITQKMEMLVQAKDEFRTLIHQANLVDCSAYRLPEISRKNENKKPDFIPVEIDNSPQANIDLVKELNRWYAVEGHSTKAAHRLPGYLHFQMNKSEYIEFENAVNTLNIAKKEFKEAVLKIENPNKRFEILHSKFQYLITINVYRQLRLFIEPNSVSFHWANKPLVNKVDIKKLKKRITNSKQVNKKLHEQQWEDLVQQELHILNSIKEPENLRFYRTTKTQPVVTVNNKQYPCPIPIILVTLIDKELDINHLKSYEKGNLRQGTGQKASNYIPVIDRLDLFIQKRISLVKSL